MLKQISAKAALLLVLLAVLSYCEQQVIESEEQFDFFSKFDTDNNNQITPEEFTNYIVSQDEIISEFVDTEREQIVETITMAFKVYDVDENQVICRKEFDLFEKQMNALHDAPEDQEL